MLEFIVLGQIPGTGIVVTFPWIVAGVIVLGSVSLVRYKHAYRNLMQRVEIEEVAL